MSSVKSYSNQNGGKTITLKSLLLFGMLFTLVFDYRRSVADSSSLVIFLSLINIFCSASLILILNSFKKKILYYSFPILLFIITSTISGIMRDQSIYSVFAQILPAVIFFQTVLVFSSIIQEQSESINILKLIVLSGVLSGIWKLIFTFSYSGLNLEDVRYQIISGATIMLFSYAVTCFIIEKRKYMWVALFLSLGVVFISVTRTYILVFAFSAFITALCLPSSRLKSNLIKCCFLVFALIFSLFILQLFFPSISERWIQRIFSYQSTGGEDITALTRIAEINGQIDFMKRDFLGFLFGFGIAAPTEWSGKEMAHLYTILGIDAESEGYSYGHNFYIGCMYVGGVFSGILLIFTLLYSPLKGLVKLKKYFNKLSQNERFLAVFSICAVLGYSAFGLLGGTLGDRVMSFYYGVVFGLLLAFNTLKVK